MWNFLFSFRGRASRADIWKFAIACIVLVLGLSVVFKPMRDSNILVLAQEALNPSPLADLLLLIFLLLVSCLILIAGLALTTRRLHDREKSAWWLIPFWALPRLAGILVPSGWFAHTSHKWFDLPVTLIGIGLGFWAFLELFCFSGSIGENDYGHDPLPRPVINPFSGEQTQ